MAQKRGQLTGRIKEKSKELLGYEIAVKELRLMAYAQYCSVNDQRMERGHISDGDREIITAWKEKGFITGGVGSQGFKVSKDFWDAMCEILFLGYVDLTE